MAQTTPHSQLLDPLRFPLLGSRLIEASAGTGKTYTIAALYVRLVLGHGGACESDAHETRGDVREARSDVRGPAQAELFPTEARSTELPLAETTASVLSPRQPSEILVVTFTDAATKELRERIRARLAEAAEAFRAAVQAAAEGSAHPAEAIEDEFLRALCAEYPTGQWAGKARLLQRAAESMDEAAVSTIHAWCKRMLREHAFDSGSLLDQRLETSHDELLTEVVRDYWRTFVMPLDRAAIDVILRKWSGPDALGAALRALLPHVQRIAGAHSPGETVADWLRERQALLEPLHHSGAHWAEQLRQLLQQAIAAKAVDGRKIQPRYYEPWLTRLEAWCAQPLTAEEPLLDTGWKRLTPDGLGEAWKNGTPPAHPALAEIARVRSALDALPGTEEPVLCHAVHWVAVRFATEKNRRAEMGFDDLLTRLADALDSEQGAVLAARIREKFPVALIDEFQDTDPVQYRSFDAVYRVRDPHPGTALILIGDPKQAIYAFRGADIHTYLQARRDCEGRLYTLDRNFRSTHAMVDAVNRCFAQAEAREEGRGAFLFRDGDGTSLPFFPVRARGRDDVLHVDGASPPALTTWWLPPNEDGSALTGGEAVRQLAEACATDLVHWLNLGQCGRAGFVDAGGTGLGPGTGLLRPLRPRDTVVLVNTGREAAAIRAALARRGVRSVYLSDRDSVFVTPQAVEMLHWLTACAEPDDASRVRSALATATLGLDWAALDALRHDENVWESRVMQFRGYRDTWRREGVLPMLRRLLHDFGVPARLLDPRRPGRDGERVLTNLLHLAELLQRAAGVLDGEHALLRHLAEQMRAEAEGVVSGDDTRQLRLESDDDLVRVITVHKSKGLEYPLVFMPFAHTFRAVTAKTMPLKLHDGTGALQVCIAGDDEQIARADDERLGEDLRKLYVALTRARHVMRVGLAPVDKLERSAFGYLLAAGAEIAPDGLETALRQLAGECEAIEVARAPEVNEQHFAARDAVPAWGPARAMRRAVGEHWWIASYSAIARLADPSVGAVSVADTAQASEPETADEDVFHEAYTASRSLPTAVVAGTPFGIGAAEDGVADIESDIAAPTATAGEGSEALRTLHGFPRGAEAGTLLHDLLETAADQGFARVADDPACMAQTIARRCRAHGWDDWGASLEAWLPAFLRRRLVLTDSTGAQDEAVVLAALDSVLPEMEFWIAARAVRTQDIDRLVRAHTLDGIDRPELTPMRLNGMLKGFIDLIFEHRGKYYVADYKSNHLGEDDSAYTHDAMRASIAAKRYDLQYVLYLLALHRLLRARLPDYDYDTHVGGAVYLFLRGGAAVTGGVHFERPPRLLIETLDAWFSGSSAASTLDHHELIGEAEVKT